MRESVNFLALLLLLPAQTSSLSVSISLPLSSSLSSHCIAPFLSSRMQSLFREALSCWALCRVMGWMEGGRERGERLFLFHGLREISKHGPLTNRKHGTHPVIDPPCTLSSLICYPHEPRSYTNAIQHLQCIRNVFRPLDFFHILLLYSLILMG